MTASIQGGSDHTTRGKYGVPPVKWSTHRVSTTEQKPAMWRSKSRPLEGYESDVNNAQRAQACALSM